MYQVLNKVVAEMTASGQAFEVKDTVVAGNTLKTWANAAPSMRHLWLDSVKQGDADYLVYENERITYAQAHEQVARIANWFTAHGIKQHDRVAIAMRNYPEWILAYWALTCIGAVSVGVNAWWVADELKYALEDSSPKMLICDQERLDRFCEVRDDFSDMPVVCVRADNVLDWITPWPELLKADAAMPDVNIDPEDDVCIFYTSGTTGYPKGAQLTHRGCANNAMTYLFATGSQLTAQAHIDGTSPTQLPDQPQPSIILSTPLFHVTASSIAHTLTVIGAKLIHSYKWSATEALRIIEKERVTSFIGVPVMCRELLNHPDFESKDTSSLQSIGGGGAAVTPDLIEKIMKDSITPGQGYGLTETSGTVASAAGAFIQGKPNATGRVSPIFEAKCIDEKGNTLPAGQTGEICLRGPQIIKGYLNRPEATAEAIVDGWFHTGDIGFIDEDRFLYLVDRIKDMVLRGGENVYSSEVEAALYKHPDIAECSVFAVPDERLGEEVAAAIYPAKGKNPSAEEIRAFCSTKIAAFKVPRYIWLMDEPLPQNASGKFVKRTLRDMLDINKAG